MDVGQSGVLRMSLTPGFYLSFSSFFLPSQAHPGSHPIPTLIYTSLKYPLPSPALRSLSPPSPRGYGDDLRSDIPRIFLPPSLPTSEGFILGMS